MMNSFEEMQKLSKDNMDMAMESFGSMSKGMQAIAAEVADYQKKSFEEGTAAVEKLVASKSLDKAFRSTGRLCQNRLRRFCRRNDQTR